MTATIVFDFGGVLIDWNPRFLYRRVFEGDDLAMERFLAEVCTTEWNLRQDAGRPWSEAIAECVARHPDFAPQIRAYRERWIETLGEPIAGSLEILAELRAAGHRLYGLTNWSHETFPLAYARHRFLRDSFLGVVVSGEEGMIKPDPRLFRVLMDRYAIAPGSVFIDDNLANVEAAAGVGLQAIHFRSPEQLRDELGGLGLWWDGQRARQ
jgi:2-haloacid dehalogenase